MNIVCIEISKYTKSELSNIARDLNLQWLNLGLFKELEAIKIWISMDNE